MPLLADGRLRLRAHKAMPMQQAADAHRQLEIGNLHQRSRLALVRVDQASNSLQIQPPVVRGGMPEPECTWLHYTGAVKGHTRRG
jgi:hypothetical protein